MNQNSSETKKSEQQKSDRKELEHRVRDDFVKKWSEIYQNEYDHLVTLVGRTPEPIIRTILSIKPKKVLFVYTEETHHYIDEIVEETKLKPSDFEKMPVNGSKPDDIYESIKKYVPVWSRMCVDISGGKKAMTSGAAIAAAFLNLDILYNDYDIYNVELRMPEPGSEFLNKLNNPFDTSQDILEHIGTELFNNSDFYNAGMMFEKAAEVALNPLRFEILLHMSNAYHNWDSFEFASAKQSFETALAKMKQYHIDLGFDNDVLQHHKKILNILEGVHEHKYMDALCDLDITKTLVYTCYASALRMECCGRFTDGVLRLYRCCEMMAQHRLAQKDIETSNVDTINMNEHVIKDFQKIKADILSKRSKKPINPSSIAINDRIGLFDDYILLNAMNDELASNINLQQMFSAIEARNQSYVEHDIQTVNKKSYQRMKDVIDTILMQFHKINDFDPEEWKNYRFAAINNKTQSNKSINHQ